MIKQKKVISVKYKIPELTDDDEKTETNETVSKPNIGELITLLFKTRDLAHSKHLSSTSYSEHIALNTLYEDILELTDEFIEAYQGCYGLVEIKIESVESVDDMIEYLKQAKDKIKEYHSETEESFLQNILDEILSLIARTIYKLTYLK